MTISLFWVQNSLRDFSQSAAHGLLFGAAWSLKAQSNQIYNYLLITNDKQGFINTNPSSALAIVNNWLSRARIPASNGLEIFEDILLFKPESPGYCITQCNSTRSLDDIENIKSGSRFFLFNNSYPSLEYLERVSRKGLTSIYLAMAPTATVDGRFSIITSTQVDSIIRLQGDGHTTHLIPMRMPHFFKAGHTKGKTDPETVTICSSGEDILNRLHIDDYLVIMFPLLNKFSTLRWLIVGVTREQLENLKRSRPHVYNQLAMFSGSGRIVLHGRVEGGFLDFVVTHSDIFFKGSHAGGGTTVSGCINSCLPVVDMVYADSRSFLPSFLSASDRDHAANLLSKLISSADYRRDFAGMQKKELDAHNNGKWANELVAVLNERLTGKSYFDVRFPREVKG